MVWAVFSVQESWREMANCGIIICLNTHIQKIRISLALLCSALVMMACIALGMQMVERLIYELRMPFTWDTTLYIAVGRGILNGLTPYADLYENKPPGIFLMSALSLWLTGGRVLGSVFQTIAIVGIPIMLALVTLRTLRGKSALM